MRRVLVNLIIIVICAANCSCSYAPVSSSMQTSLKTLTPETNQITYEATTTSNSIASSSLPAESSALFSSVAEPATPTPVPEETDEAATTPDYYIADLKSVGLSNEEYRKIACMLYSASNAGLYMKNVSKLSDKDYLYFCFWVLNEISYSDFGSGIVIDTDMETSDCVVSLGSIREILSSAFGKEYSSKYAGSYDDIGIYRKGDRFLFYQVEGGSYAYPYVYKIQRISNNRIKLSIDIVTSTNFDSTFTAKAEAIIEENKESIFGFRLVSMKKTRVSEPRFNIVQASSVLSQTDSMNFHPRNVLDRDIKTIWASKPGKEQWIKISSGSPQTITGFIYRFDDFTEDSYDFAIPAPIESIEFSDGTVFRLRESNVYTGFFVSFGKAIKTTYIKINMVGEDTDKLGYYLADFIPY